MMELKVNNHSTKEHEFVAESEAMRKIDAMIDRIAGVDFTALILGESGVGKEIIAREIHRRSPRRDKEFIAINCAALPAELLESELFGHSRGSFTGAIQQKRGLFEEANGGTLFLDEIGDMSLTSQAKLLRVLQEKTIRPVGSNKSKELDVRVIAATHRQLETMIAGGSFREDLFYRLNVLPLYVPPLRERPEDIRSLTGLFAKRTAVLMGEKTKIFSNESLDKLLSFDWPGNVRELQNAVERCLVMCNGTVVQPEHLEFLHEVKSTVEVSDEDSLFATDSLSLKKIEEKAVRLALQRTSGRKAAAAKLLGIDRKTLHRKEVEYFTNDKV